MQNLPTASVYEKEFKYMPWGMLISEVREFVSKNAPANGKVLDLLCGPGYLLGKLQEDRKDLQYLGVDLESEYIEYAKNQYPTISFETHDAFTWESAETFDVVLVTAGLHHLPYDQQESFIKKVSELVARDGFAIIGDPYIDDFSNETERKIAGAKLGYEYLAATIRSGGTEDVVDAAIGVLTNDVKLVEWKSSIIKNKPLFEKYFTSVEMHKTWPKEETEYGDYYFILKH
jgi:2-polyprenyl-3-methyl-5-hydroxy-6-metoxy-1,4-benzoquinol methylase